MPDTSGRVTDGQRCGLPGDAVMRMGGILFALSLFSTKTGLDTAVWVLSVGALWAVIRERRWEDFKEPATIRFLTWSACFLAVAAVASLGSADPTSSVKRMIILLGYYGLFAAAVLTDIRRVRFLGMVLAYVCAAECVVAVSQAAGVPLVRRAGTFVAGRRGMGTLGSPNDLAAALAIFIPMLVAYLRHARLVRSRLFAAGTLTLAGAGLIASLTRGAWLAVFVALIVMGMVASRRLLLATIFAAVTVLAVPAVYTRASATLANPERTRLHYLRTVPVFIVRRPVLGWGLDTFKKVYYPVHPDPRGKEHFHPHNMFLNIAFQTGIVGLICFCGMLWTVWCQALVAARATASDRGWVGLGMLGALTAFMVMGLFDDPFRAYQAPYLLYAVFGILLRQDSLDSRAHRSPPDRLPGHRNHHFAHHMVRMV